MPAKRRGKAVLIPSSPAYSFGSSQRQKPSAGVAPGPGTYNIHGEAPHPPPRGSKVSTRSQIDPRGNLLGSTTTHPQSCNRSSPSINIASKPIVRMQDRSPGPGDYEDSTHSVNPRHPSYTCRGLNYPDFDDAFPGPGKYQWGPNADRLHPNTAEPVSIKFRRAIPGDKTRRPGPDEYSPMSQLDVYKGDYTKCTMKFRSKPKLTELYPDPGPGEYSPKIRGGTRPPQYTIRLKLAADLDPPPYPGPGTYDVESSTIGNWGAGMAAHLPPEGRDIFLNERIEVFRRQAAPSPQYSDFLEQNRKTLIGMQRAELAYGTQRKAPKAAAVRRTYENGKHTPSSRKQSSKHGSKLPAVTEDAAGAKVGGSSLHDADTPDTPVASGLLVAQHLYEDT